MPALNGTIPFAVMINITKHITQNLDFDMPWIFKKLFYINITVAESRLGLAACSLECFFKFIRIPHNPHSFSAASGRRLYYYRVADISGNLPAFFYIAYHTVAAGYYR